MLLSRINTFVAVGMRITAHPPRRSRRAEFPHRALGLGDNVVGFGVVATHPVPRRHRVGALGTQIRHSVRGVCSHSAFPSPRCLPSLPSAARRARRCSGRSLVLRTRPTSHGRASSATAPCLPDADQTASACGRPRDLPVPAQGACAHARVSDRAGSAGGSPYRRLPCCLPLSRRRRHPEANFRGSMAGLCVPLSTLRHALAGRRRMTRGQCGSLLLHCSGLSPHTPCRSPGAPRQLLRSSSG